MFPLKVFLTVLAIVFAAEMVVMFLLPHIFPPGTDPRWEALPDACLLTLISGPLLWWAVIRPLRQLAVTEQAKSESIVAAAVEGIITIDQRGIVESFNRAAELIFGYAAHEIIGRDVAVLMPERLAAQHKAGFRRYLATGESRVLGRTMEIAARRKDGSEVPLAMSLAAVRLGDRQLFTGVVRDLTEQKRVEAERQARARMQAAAFEFGQRALACDDVPTLLDEAVRCVAQTLDVEYSLVWEALPEGDSLVLRAGAGWREGTVGQTTWQTRMEVCPEGRPFPCPAFAGPALGRKHCGRCPPLLHEHGVANGVSVVIQGAQWPFGVLGAYTARERTFVKDEAHFLQDIAIEITLAIQRKQAELRQRERDVARAEQMAAVAQIATGVAHEIRNPLTSIKMLVQAIQEEGAASDLEKEDLRIIEGEIRRMEQCLQTFLDFARPARPQRRCVDLASLVARTFTLTEARSQRQSVVLRFAPPAEPALVEADWAQIQQLLLNLTLNALDAMPQGGVLECDLHPCEGGWIELRVHDSGPGIESQILPRLFQPFVTGKETGLGLGLVISRRIAEDHGGTLTAENRPQGGACFILRLPAASVVESA